MRPYLDLLAKIMDQGVAVQTGATLTSEGRKPTARRLHAAQIRFDLAAGFPSVTTKPLWWRAVVAEWIWFMRGTGDARYLIDQKVDSIWRAWFKEGSTDLGPVYGRQFRAMQGVEWGGPLPPIAAVLADGVVIGAPAPYRRFYWLNDDGCVYTVKHPDFAAIDGADPQILHFKRCQGAVVETDQIGNARDDIRAVIADPFNRARRRIIVSLWNPAQVPAMALPPCHTIHMYDLVPPAGPSGGIPRPGGGESTIAPLDPRWTLSLHLFARSIDAVKGLPFNIASYALMCHVMAAITGCRPGTLTITFNDVHVYDNQFADVEEQLQREPHPLPTLKIADEFFASCKDLTIAEAHALTPALFKLDGYQHHPRLKSESEVAV